MQNPVKYTPGHCCGPESSPNLCRARGRFATHLGVGAQRVVQCQEEAVLACFEARKASEGSEVFKKYQKMLGVC